MSEQTKVIDDPLMVAGAAMPEHMQPLVESLAKSSGLLGPNEVAQHLHPQIEELGLGDALAHFREHGYAVIEDVAPPQEMDELRQAIHDFSKPYPGIDHYRGAPFLLGRHPAIDRICTNAKIRAFAEVSVGNGFRASQITSSVMFKSDVDSGGVHADQGWIPAPFPEHNCIITFCIPCEGMTEAGGATRVVPGSHLRRRHPTPQETRSETVAIEVAKGGVAVWDGSVWHGGGQRTIDGTRTVLHASYSRLYTQTIDDYTYLLEDEAYMASAPEGMRGLLGDGLFFGTGNVEGGVDIDKIKEAAIRSKL